MKKNYRYRKTKQDIRVMYTDDQLNSGSVFTVSWDDLKQFLEKNTIGAIGFRVNEKGIDVFHDRAMSVGESRNLRERVGL